MKARKQEQTALTIIASSEEMPRSTDKQAPKVERAIAIQKISPKQAGRYNRATIQLLNFSLKGSNMVMYSFSLIFLQNRIAPKKKHTA